MTNFVANVGPLRIMLGVSMDAWGFGLFVRKISMGERRLLFVVRAGPLHLQAMRRIYWR